MARLVKCLLQSHENLSDFYNSHKNKQKAQVWFMLIILVCWGGGTGGSLGLRG